MNSIDYSETQPVECKDCAKELAQSQRALEEALDKIMTLQAKVRSLQDMLWMERKGEARMERIEDETA